MALQRIFWVPGILLLAYIVVREIQKKKQKTKRDIQFPLNSQGQPPQPVQ